MDVLAGEGHGAGEPFDALLARVWNALFAEPAEFAALLAQLQALASAEGDAETEGLALALQAFDSVTTRPEADALQALARVRDAVSRTGSRRGGWICDDLHALLDLRHGRHAAARARLEAHAGQAARGAGERVFTWWHLQVLHLEASEHEASLEAGQRMLEIAAAHGLVAFEGVALLAMAAVHIVVLDFAEGVVMQDAAARHLAAAGATRMLPVCHANRIFTHYAAGRPARAAEALREWQCAGAGVGREAHKVALALGHLAAGDLDTAEAVLGDAPPGGPLARHQRCAWHWVRARLLLARGQPEAAAALCRSWLERAPDAVADTPLNRVQLHEALRDAAERSGDLRAALDAAKAVRAVEVPQFALHARVRYRALQLQLRAQGGIADPQRDRRRLEAVDRAIEHHRAHWEADAAPAVDVQAATRRFVAQVSHEIRTPLTGVMGLTDLLLRSDLDAQQRRLVELARTSADSMMRLLNDILDLARLEAGRFTLDPQPFSLRELVQELAATTAPLARERHLRFDVDVDPRLPGQVQGDALRVRQVLGNLLGNALKFTPQGGIELRVRAGEGLTRIEVHDTGVGIPAELRERLFAEFEKSAASTGSGLGLAISQQLVRRMGGEMGADDRPGGGSVFWITLPLPAVD